MPGEASRQMAILGALQGDDICLTTQAMVEASGLRREDVSKACCRLVSRGLIVRRERGCFELSEAGRAALAAGLEIKSGPADVLTASVPRRPRRETDRDRIWRAIRMLGKFSLQDLCSRTGASQDNVYRYVRVLAAAGYLAELRRAPGLAPTSNGFCRWSLLVDPGVDAPIYRAPAREVWDPNSATTRPLPDRREVRA